jgi:uncharacterized membrane protein
MLGIMNEKRQQVLKWQQQGLIDNNDVEKALLITDANSSPSQWYAFVSQSILWLGILSIAFGVIFFFAYNWNQISIFTKFALIQGLMLLSLFLYAQTKSSAYTSTALLFFLALLVGALLALFGQTYQTGKDPWQLFLLWTLFMTPIALISKSSSLWLLWLALANLTLSLVLDVHYGFLGMLFDNERNLLLYAFLNLYAAEFFELFYHKFGLLTKRVVSQVALVITMVCFSWVSIYSLFEFTKHSFDLFLYLIWMAAIYYFYRLKTTDVLVLSSWVISGIIFIVGFIAKSIDHGFGGATLLLLGLMTIGLSTAGVKWLMKLLQESNDLGEIS